MASILRYPQPQRPGSARPAAAKSNSPARGPLAGLQRQVVASIALAHLPRADRQRLTDEGAAALDARLTKTDHWGDLMVSADAYGVTVLVPGNTAADLSAYSNAFRALVDAARDSKIDYLRFDDTAPPAPGFPVFEP